MLHDKGITTKRVGGLAALTAGLALYASSLGGIAAIDGTLATAEKPDRSIRVVAEWDCPYRERV